MVLVMARRQHGDSKQLIDKIAKYNKLLLHGQAGVTLGSLVVALGSVSLPPGPMLPLDRCTFTPEDLPGFFGEGSQVDGVLASRDVTRHDAAVAS
jgi:hypothetical protein